MAAAVGQFGVVYMEESGGVWWTLPGVTMEVNNTMVTVLAIEPLDSGIQVSQQKAYVVRASYSETTPTTGERIFVPST